MRQDVATALAEGDFEAALDASRTDDPGVEALALERLGRLDEALARCEAQLAARPNDVLALLVKCAAPSRRGERMSETV